MPARQEHSEELVVPLQRCVDRLAGLIGPRHVGRPSSLDAAAYQLPSKSSLPLSGALPETPDYSRMAQATLGVVGAVPLLAGDLG